MIWANYCGKCQNELMVAGAPCPVCGPSPDTRPEHARSLPLLSKRSKDIQLGELFVLCPITGHALTTGIFILRAAKAENMKGSLIYCKHCKDRHAWNGADAFFKNGERLK